MAYFYRFFKLSILLYYLFSITILIQGSYVDSNFIKKLLTETQKTLDNAQRAQLDTRTLLQKFHENLATLESISTNKITGNLLTINDDKSLDITLSNNGTILFHWRYDWNAEFEEKHESNVWFLRKEGHDIVLLRKEDTLQIRIKHGKGVFLEKAAHRWKIRTNQPLYFCDHIFDTLQLHLQGPKVIFGKASRLITLKTTGDIINHGKLLVQNLCGDNIHNYGSITFIDEIENLCAANNFFENVGKLNIHNPTDFSCKNFINNDEIEIRSRVKIVVKETFSNDSEGVFNGYSTLPINLHLLEFKNAGILNCKTLNLRGNQFTNEGTLHGKVISIKMSEILNKANIQASDELSLYGNLTNEIQASLFGGNVLFLKQNVNSFIRPHAKILHSKSIHSLGKLI